jgi:hypothetical protein
MIDAADRGIVLSGDGRSGEEEKKGGKAAETGSHAILPKGEWSCRSNGARGRALLRPGLERFG